MKKLKSYFWSDIFFPSCFILFLFCLFAYYFGYLLFQPCKPYFVLCDSKVRTTTTTPLDFFSRRVEIREVIREVPKIEYRDKIISQVDDSQINAFKSQIANLITERDLLANKNLLIEKENQDLMIKNTNLEFSDNLEKINFLNTQILKLREELAKEKQNVKEVIKKVVDEDQINQLKKELEEERNKFKEKIVEKGTVVICSHDSKLQRLEKMLLDEEREHSQITHDVLKEVRRLELELDKHRLEMVKNEKLDFLDKTDYEALKSQRDSVLEKFLVNENALNLKNISDLERKLEKEKKRVKKLEEEKTKIAKEKEDLLKRTDAVNLELQKVNSEKQSISSENTKLRKSDSLAIKTESEYQASSESSNLEKKSSSNRGWFGWGS